MSFVLEGDAFAMTRPIITTRTLNTCLQCMRRLTVWIDAMGTLQVELESVIMRGEHVREQIRCGQGLRAWVVCFAQADRSCIAAW